MESVTSSAPSDPGHASSSQLPRPKPSPLSTLEIPQADLGHRNGQVSLDTFSPVNPNGSYEYDRVLKSGEVYKRTRKTKVCIHFGTKFSPLIIELPQNWKACYLVLRPNLLSIYKSSAEDRLHKLISLSELTAVAYLKDPKGRRNNVFGLFSPSRDFHLQAMDEEDLREWVELIKHESRIDEDEQEILLGSPIDVGAGGPDNIRKEFKDSWDEERLGSSSPEPHNLFSGPRTTAPDGGSRRRLRRPSAYETEYSGDDLGLHSDLSDAAIPSSISETLSRMARHRHGQSTSKEDSALSPSDLAQSYRSGTEHNSSQMSIVQTDQDDARVIRHGYLLCLKSKGGVRQWKRHWVVLRHKNIAFYKSEDVSEFLLRCFVYRSGQELNQERRSMLRISSSRFRISSARLKSTQFPKANLTACKSSLQTKDIGSAPLVKRRWLGG